MRPDADEIDPVVAHAMVVLREHFGSVVVLVPRSKRTVWEVRLGDFFRCKYMVAKAYEEATHELSIVRKDDPPKE